MGRSGGRPGEGVDVWETGYACLVGDLFAPCSGIRGGARRHSEPLALGACPEAGHWLAPRQSGYRLYPGALSHVSACQELLHHLRTVRLCLPRLQQRQTGFNHCRPPSRPSGPRLIRYPITAVTVRSGASYPVPHASNRCDDTWGFMAAPTPTTPLAGGHQKGRLLPVGTRRWSAPEFGGRRSSHRRPDRSACRWTSSCGSR